MNRADLRLVERTAVVSVGESLQHDVANVHHGYLSSRGVIPPDWKPTESYLTPSFATIEYGDGFRLLGDEDMFRVSQTENLKIGEENIPIGLAVKYVASISPDVFRNAGVESTILIPFESPHGWIADRFFRREVISGNWNLVRTIPSFRIEVEELQLSLTFFGGGRSPGGEGEDSVIRVVSRVGHEPFSNDGELIGWLSEWPKHEQVALSILISLIGLENDMA